MTFAMAMLSGLVWYICTAGSDQVAVQRYLSTENLKAARRMYTTSILFNGLVLSFLGILGLALLSFFRENPRFVPDAQTIVSDADQLFPQFISIGLPTGVSGLVIAALLAAAMSSLSSGINSACSVISVDFVDKIKRKKGTEQNHIQRTKYISWIVGFFVVFLSLFASLVEGNLLAVAFKVANLLTAPLFVLFFMSMFVPWATIFGTWMAALLSVAAAVGIAYFNIFGLSFIWLMPVSLVTGVLAGVSASLLPIGPPPKPPLPKENSIGD
jgi:SSS family solute:Na+ symporter